MNSDLVNKIFGKDIYSITSEDMLHFFEEEQEESAVIEFKSGDIDILKIFREIAAFLNSEGGILIIGSPREQTKDVNSTTVKYCKGELIPSHFKSKDWLIQKISSNIIPAPANIKIHEIYFRDGRCYILDIPQSFTPPHQCEDGKYYIRLEREAKAASHGLVESLFLKRQKSCLEIDVSIYSKIDDENVRIVSVSLRNSSAVNAQNVIYRMELWGTFIIEEEDNIQRIPNPPPFCYISQSIYPHSLVKGISIPFGLSFRDMNKKFFISISFWSSDSKLNYIALVYDPVSKAILKECSSKHDELIDYPALIDLLDESVKTAFINNVSKYYLL